MKLGHGEPFKIPLVTSYMRCKLPSADFQAILLSFFGQELVAHAATAIAGLGGIFLYMRSFRPEKRARLRRQFIYRAVSGFLIVLVVYAGFRMISYGQLAYVVMTHDPQPEHAGLSQYYAYIAQTAIGKPPNATTPLNDRINTEVRRGVNVFRYPTNSPWPLTIVGAIWLAWIFPALIWDKYRNHRASRDTDP